MTTFIHQLDTSCGFKVTNYFVQNTWLNREASEVGRRNGVSCKELEHLEKKMQESTLMATEELENEKQNGLRRFILKLIHTSNKS